MDFPFLNIIMDLGNDHQQMSEAKVNGELSIKLIRLTSPE